jgi:hypothetical protein
LVSEISSLAILELIHYTRRRRHEFSVMDPNLKIVLEEMVKIRRSGTGSQRRRPPSPSSSMRFPLRTSSARRQPGGCGHDIREELFRVAPRGGFLHRLRQARALEVEHLLRSGGQGGWCFHERSTPCRVGAIIFSDGRRPQWAPRRIKPPGLWIWASFYPNP